MSKCLYVLKFSLLQHQIPSLTAVTKKKINTMSSFILFTYLSYWFTSPSLARAASNDLKMYQDLSSFRRVNKAVSESCLLVLQRHTWYLTEDLVPVALFNKDFLLAENWRDTPQYVSMEKVITSLTPINDYSERALALATSFNGKITRYEESFQNMMLVVAAHRKKYGYKTKTDLKSFVWICLCDYSFIDIMFYIQTKNLPTDFAIFTMWAWLTGYGSLTETWNQV